MMPLVAFWKTLRRRHVSEYIAYEGGNTSRKSLIHVMITGNVGHIHKISLLSYTKENLSIYVKSWKNPI